MSYRYIGGFLTNSPVQPTTSSAVGIWTLTQQSQAKGNAIWPSPPPTYTVTGAAGSINEGSALTVNVSGLNITNGTYYWTIDSNAGDFSSSSGSFTITSNAGSFTVTPTADVTTEGAETFTVSIRSGSTSGTILSTSDSLTINDTSTAPVVPTVIGQSFGGGYYAGQIGVSSVATHYLIVGPKASAQSGSTLQYRTSFGSNAGATSEINGPSNTTAINDASHPAAQFCEALSTGGQTDWYLPAKNELEVCYYNLKPTTTVNSTIYGSNANAVPTRGNYTTGSPAQTSAAVFVTSTGAEAFDPNFYWSSTSVSNYGAWAQSFGYGYAYSPGTTNYRRVRAVRRIAV